LAFAPEQVDRHIEYELHDAAGRKRLGDWRFVQQIERNRPANYTPHVA